jgi:hypothetical protein
MSQQRGHSASLLPLRPLEKTLPRGAAVPALPGGPNEVCGSLVEKLSPLRAVSRTCWQK